MKVLQLGKFYPIKGGVECVMEIFTEGLAERGYPCDMLCAAHDGHVDDIILGEETRFMCAQGRSHDDLPDDDRPP